MTSDVVSLDVNWRNRCERLLSHIVDTDRQSHEKRCAADLMLTALRINPKRNIFNEVAEQLERDGEFHSAENVRELIEILECVTSVDFKIRNPPPTTI